MKLVKPSKAQSEHVEYAGRWWESVSGGSRTAGRMLGWLMVCEPAHQSSAEMTDALQASAGSISTQSRMLEAIGVLERVTFPGDRQTYYQLPIHVWVDLMWAEQDRLKGLMRVAEKAEPAMPRERPDRVADLGRIAQFFIDEWPSLMERLTAYLEKETTA